ncbi:MAG: topology modulation protein [Proteobacteria bacterium]|nr:topology modulation protein [Pseudomonadota bacterium]
MDRIAVIGCSGGGKSTLARKLCARLGLPAVHLDVLFWRPGWVESDDASFHQRLSDALAGGRWVSDGNFSRHGDLHFAGAELIVWVDQPRAVCVRRALWRAVTQFGRKRADMAEGCREKIDPKFIAYIWTWNRVTRPRIEAALAAHAPGTPMVRLTSDRAIAEWLEAFAPG